VRGAPLREAPGEEEPGSRSSTKRGGVPGKEIVVEEEAKRTWARSCWATGDRPPGCSWARTCLRRMIAWGGGDRPLGAPWRGAKVQGTEKLLGPEEELLVPEVEGAGRGRMVRVEGGGGW
jgi:hypothetical protein